MRTLLLIVLVSACQKPQSMRKRGALAPQTEDPAPSSPQSEPKRFRLTWAKAPRPVTAYDVRFGLTETSVTETILILDTAQGFDPENPSAEVSLSPERLAGQARACFQIVAKNSHGTSEPSDARCLSLP